MNAKMIVGRLLLRWFPSRLLAQSQRLAALALCGLSDGTRALWPSEAAGL